MAALPDDTKMQIREFLGWPARFRQSDSALEQALVYVDTDTTLQARITGSILPGIVDVYSRLTGSLDRIRFSKAGNAETQIMEIPLLRAEGRRQVNRLSSLMAVPVREDIFGANSGQSHHMGSTAGPLPGWVRRG